MLRYLYYKILHSAAWHKKVCGKMIVYSNEPPRLIIDKLDSLEKEAAELVESSRISKDEYVVRKEEIDNAKTDFLAFYYSGAHQFPLHGKRR